MDLTSISRREYSHGPTPIEHLDKLSEFLKGPEIFIKRDDHLGLAGGGNKTRKLEFLVADALKNNADTLITCGAVQSNHCRLTLSAAKREQLDCRLVLEERIPGSYNPKANGNNFLFNLLEVDDITVVPDGSDMTRAMERVAEQVYSEGKKPYIIPTGGSNEIGATGYAACAQEIISQLFEQSLDIDYIITPTGSGGTHAGLLIGMRDENIPIIGISVNKQKSEQEENVHKLAQKTSEYLNVKNKIQKDSVKIFDDYIGPGYSLPTDNMKEAIALLAQMKAYYWIRFIREK